MISSESARIFDPTPWRLCIAPMLDWTDRHCRYFHRLLTPKARLYTEMVTTGALLHGDVARHLDHHIDEHPVALQLGGSEPSELVVAARLGEKWGYAEINLNCGCPSERVQKGAFGACLMARPALVADCFKAMSDAVAVPVSIKHRIGLGRDDSEGMLHDFVGALFEAGCRVFIVHARNAWLQGLSPRDNREIPPLRPDAVKRLKSAFPTAVVIHNGGIDSPRAARAILASCTDLGAAASNEVPDGVMLGRVAYQRPDMLPLFEATLMETELTGDRRGEVVTAMVQYITSMTPTGVPPRAILRHMLGLYHGEQGARQWRRDLSDPRFVLQWGDQALAQATQRAFGAATYEPSDSAPHVAAGSQSSAPSSYAAAEPH